jgi:hypothetical protein
MASVTGNMAKEYWDDFGIVGPRTQLLKHRTLTTLILGNRPSANPGADPGGVPWYVLELHQASYVRTGIRDAALRGLRSSVGPVAGVYPDCTLPQRISFRPSPVRISNVVRSAMPRRVRETCPLPRVRLGPPANEGRRLTRYPLQASQRSRTQ